jgi:hypothetical protein
LSIFFSDVLSSPLLRLAPAAAAAAHGFCISFDAYKQLGKLLHMQQAWLSTMHRFEGQMGALAPRPPSLRTAEAPGVVAVQLKGRSSQPRLQRPLRLRPK